MKYTISKNKAAFVQTGLDNIFVLRQVMEKHVERSRYMHLVKAYDSVPLKKMFNMLNKSGLHPLLYYTGGK